MGLGLQSFAQQELDLKTCEGLFQKNNLMLLAEQYNIQSAQAQVIQSKVWENPYLSGEMNILNPSQNRYFDIGNQGQKVLAVQQLIYLGGKKKSEIEYAKTNLGVAELQFEILLKELNHQLHTCFYKLHFNLMKTKSIENQLAGLDTLLLIYNQQQVKGNVSLRDVVRLQSLSFSLRSELLEILNENKLLQGNIKLLINSNHEVQPQVDETALMSKYQVPSSIDLGQILKISLNNNSELRLLTEVQVLDEKFLQWQKTLNTGDLTMGLNYDQRGGAFNNQINLTFGIPLNLRQINKGNVLIANAQIEQMKLLKVQKENEISAKLSSEFNNLKLQQNQLMSVNEGFVKLDVVYTGVFENFKKDNITIIEFTDFMESYNQSMMYIQELKKQVILSVETINYLSNSSIL
jgi:outer membrane protein, heavy metal efflux system